MDTANWRRRGKRRTPAEESYGRDGHWRRDFSVRTEPWPIIEHWASEYGFHLIAVRGKRRLYQKGEHAFHYLTFIDVKQAESHLSFNAWIRVGWFMRLMTLFFLPSEMPVNPKGFLGIVRRRQVCREINSLLSRFKQPLILESGGFHWADLDITTLALTVGLVAGVAFFVFATTFRFELKPGLAGGLLYPIVQQAGLLVVIGLVLMTLHQGIVIRKWWIHWPVKLGSMFGALLIFVVFIVGFTLKTSSEMMEVKVTYHCIYHYRKDLCQQILGRLSPGDRSYVLGKLNLLQNELSVRPSGPLPNKR
jgi:hypothetical protein